MGRKQQAKRQSQAAPSQAPIQPGSVTAVPPAASEQLTGDRTLRWLLHLPRLVRIILIAIPALAVTLIFTPIVDTIYLRFFFSMETRMAPSIITAGIALLMYLIGWVVLVGTPGEVQQERRALRWYVGASVLLIVLASIWFTYLAITNLQA